MTRKTARALAPVLYLPHGGGPLPLLGDQSHTALIEFLKTVAGQLGTPAAILIISAHWEAAQASITSAAQPELIYDYSGFPPEAYEIQYPARGEPQLAAEIFDLLAASHIEARLDDQRGFDHGMFVPLKLMYPNADIPCVQLSLRKGLDPAAHIAMGKALAALRSKNILIIGSGMSYHNMSGFFAHTAESLAASEAFDNWLVETCTSQNMSRTESEQRLINWEAAPSARYCHPRAEHLLPLQVCYGIACVESETASVIFNKLVMGKRISSLLWS